MIETVTRIRCDGYEQKYNIVGMPMGLGPCESRLEVSNSLDANRKLRHAGWIVWDGIHFCSQECKEEYFNVTYREMIGGSE